MTVLIVDDQAEFRGFARRVLEADGCRIRLRGARKGVSPRETARLLTRLRNVSSSARLCA
jgi:hypothetical protein